MLKILESLLSILVSSIMGFIQILTLNGLVERVFGFVDPRPKQDIPRQVNPLLYVGASFALATLAAVLIHSVADSRFLEFVVFIPFVWAGSVLYDRKDEENTTNEIKFYEKKREEHLINIKTEIDEARKRRIEKRQHEAILRNAANV